MSVERWIGGLAAPGSHLLFAEVFTAVSDYGAPRSMQGSAYALLGPR